MKYILKKDKGDGVKRFYFEVPLLCRWVGLCYDYNFSWEDTFEICYFDIIDPSDIKHIRTIL